MTKRIVFLLVALAVLASVIIFASASPRNAQRRSNSPAKSNPETLLVKSAASQQRTLTAYGNRPLSFEENLGQTDPQVKYLSRGHGYTLFLTPAEAVFAMPIDSAESPLASTLRDKRPGSVAKSLRQQPVRDSRKSSVAALHMQMLGANPHPLLTAEDVQPGRTNYFIGRDPKNWHSNVPQYGRVHYQNVYPGVDVAYHGAPQLEFDFVVSPGANPEQIQLGFRGAKQMRTESSGDLVLTSAAGELRLAQPRAYQEKKGSQQAVEARFVVKDKNKVAFVLGPYDHTRQLVIDPPVSYSTYLGGGGEDEGYGIALDGSGNAYVVGAENSSNFPGASGSVMGGGGGSHDCFLTQLTPTGALGFTTIFGGESDDLALAVAVDSTGIYVTGSTSSTKFPVTSGVVQPILQGGGPFGDDAFLAKFAPNGASITWATYIGGNDTDIAFGLAVDASHNVYVVGETASNNLSVGNPLPQGLVFNGGVFDGFIAELNPTGTAYLIMSYVGGNQNDVVTGVAVSKGNVYLTGITHSPNLPSTLGAFQTTCAPDGLCNSGNDYPDAFVAAFNPTGTPPLAYSYLTYLGGGNSDAGEGIAADSAGNAYITGYTNSSASAPFPTTSNAYQASLHANATTNAFLSVLNPTGTKLVYSTYLGGSGTDAGLGIALDLNNNAYITGMTTSQDFPVNNATQKTFGGGNASGFNSDAFVSELSWTGSASTLPFSTYLGGSGDENFNGGFLAVNSGGEIFVTGDTNSTNFPATASPIDAAVNGGASQQPNCKIATPNGPKTVPCPDAFVTKYSTTTGDFSVALNPATLTVTSGQTTSPATFTVSSLTAAFTNPVTLSCSTVPAHAACKFSSTSVIPGSASATPTLTITTNGTAASGWLSTPSLRHSGLFYALLLPIGGIALVGTGLGTRKKKLLGFLMVCLALAGVIFMAACGSSTPPAVNTNNNTPAGIYKLQVTGTSGTTVHSQTLTLTVQ
jgi:Beta-propeller repeat